MLLNKIVLSETPPTSHNTVWAKPSDGGVSLYTYSNNKWGPILLMDDMGTDDPSDDLPGKVITLKLFDETILDLKDYVSENYISNIKVLITTPPATLNAQVGYYYCMGGSGVVVDTMTIQLPAIADENKTKNVQFFMTMGSAPEVTFVSAGTERILYQKDFALEAERGYEVNALWNGHAWVIAAVEIEIPETRVVATVNVTNTSGTTSILGNTSNISVVEIDGVEQQSVETDYTFSTTGEHTIKYTLTDPTSISTNTFKSCSALTSITIPNTVKRIGNSAFYSCTGLTSITIPNGVRSIEQQAFQQCTGLTSITIPNSVTNIGYNAFFTCTGLTSITIPSSVTTIGRSAFSGCEGLTSIVVNSGNTVYDSRDNCNAIINTSTNELIKGCNNTVIPNSVTSIGTGAFYKCTSLTSVIIPDSVTSIGDMAFSGCSGLTSVTIGNGLTSIGTAFNSCSSLTSITSLATTAPTIQNNTFQNVKTGGTLTVPNGSTGYDTWMGTGDFYLGKYGWTKVEQ